MFALKPHVRRQTVERFKVVIWEARFDLVVRKAGHSLRPFLFIAFYWVAELLTASHFFSIVASKWVLTPLKNIHDPKPCSPLKCFGLVIYATIIYLLKRKSFDQYSTSNVG